MRSVAGSEQPRGRAGSARKRQQTLEERAEGGVSMATSIQRATQIHFFTDVGSPAAPRPLADTSKDGNGADFRPQRCSRSPGHILTLRA